jgi:hypothetical protein
VTSGIKTPVYLSTVLADVERAAEAVVEVDVRALGPNGVLEP